METGCPSFLKQAPRQCSSRSTTTRRTETGGGGGDAASFRVSATEMAGRATKQEGAAGVRREERRADHARGEEIVVNVGVGTGAQIHGRGRPVSWMRRRPVVSVPTRLATRRSGLGLGGNNHEQDLWRWRTSGASAWGGLETVKAIQTRTPEPDGSSYTPTWSVRTEYLTPPDPAAV
jgi:hypothetical protein